MPPTLVRAEVLNQDAVRIAASNPGPEWFHHLIQSTNAKPTAFARLTRAWRHGGPTGPTGITVAEQPHAPDPTVMKATRTALDAALAEMTDSPTHLRTWRNRLTVTHHGIQLCLGPDARWYCRERTARSAHTVVCSRLWLTPHASR
ncbi:hypothetical protein [Streptomyces violaceus]|uniref:Uncharacterized protein n=1 Tax=Streptomyces violaceus TaxID=1936 RepID=A0ABZ1NUC5_STRVL